MAKLERHLTIEQLSAWLDGQLATDEQAQSDVHLSTCEQCRHELEHLRQTVALLHALPQPTLPRSFLLTESVLASTDTPDSEGTLAHVGIQRTPEFTIIQPKAPVRSRGWYTDAQKTLRTLSALAAVAGLLLFLSGLLPTTFVAVHQAASTASSGGQAAPQAQPHTSTGNAQGTPSGTNMTPAIQAATPQVQATPAAQPSAPSPFQNVFATLSPTTGQGRLLLGGFLLVVGMLGFFLIRRHRPRAG